MVFEQDGLRIILSLTLTLTLSLMHTLTLTLTLTGFFKSTSLKPYFYFTPSAKALAILFELLLETLQYLDSSKALTLTLTLTLRIPSAAYACSTL